MGGSGGEKCPVEGSGQLQESRDLPTHFSILTSIWAALVSVAELSINPASSVFYPPLRGIGAGNAQVRPSLGLFAFSLNLYSSPFSSLVHVVLQRLCPNRRPVRVSAVPVFSSALHPSPSFVEL